jgi:hypothetical protein
MAAARTAAGPTKGCLDYRDTRMKMRTLNGGRLARR